MKHVKKLLFKVSVSILWNSERMKLRNTLVENDRDKVNAWPCPASQWPLAPSWDIILPRRRASTHLCLCAFAVGIWWIREGKWIQNKSTYSNICAHSEPWLRICSGSLGFSMRTPMRTGWIYITRPKNTSLKSQSCEIIKPQLRRTIWLQLPLQRLVFISHLLTFPSLPSCIYIIVAPKWPGFHSCRVLLGVSGSRSATDKHYLSDLRLEKQY